MRVEVRFINPAKIPYFEKTDIRAILLERQKERRSSTSVIAATSDSYTGTFVTAWSPVLSAPVDWKNTTQAQYVPVPVFQYETAKTDALSLLTCGAELGLRAGYSAAQHFRAVPDVVYIILGDRCESRDAVIYYCLGITLLFEDKNGN